jgi:hypothetical protein
MFEKLKVQADAMVCFSQHIDRLRASTALEDRLIFLEHRFDEVFGKPGSEPKLSPFRQQEALDRLQQLESSMGQHSDDLKDLHTVTHQVRALRKYPSRSMAFPCH